MQIDALGDRWLPQDLPQLPPTRWAHVAPLARHEFPAETIAALARRCRVSFDGQGLVSVPEIGPLRLDTDYDPALLRHIWVLKLSEEEAEVIGDLNALGVREVIVTRGSRGADRPRRRHERARRAHADSTPIRRERVTPS